MGDFNSVVIHRGTVNGDDYKRVEISPNSGVYQCGCHWEKYDNEYGKGDVLKECALHHAATAASVKKFDREREQ
jgi:hypothetical protein